MSDTRRMLEPWTAEEGDNSYVVRTANGFLVSITYFDDEPNRVFNLRKDEARRITLAISRLPDLLERARKGLMDGAGRDPKAVPPDDVIVNVLDDTWQTPTQIRIRLQEPAESGPLVDTLERL